jgi:SAM-dependent methyltransferase
MICPLCFGAESEIFDQDKMRSYLKCSVCDLIFVPRDSLISSSAEKERYEAHENEENENYTNYLNKTVNAIKPHLQSAGTGLDFGCGHTKILERIFEENGFSVQSYDLFFHPDTNLLSHRYDFIILSEVIEHLRDPREIMLNLKRNLHPHGQFFIKTRLRPKSAVEFSKWFYKRDSTHIQFFNESSFNALTEILGMKSVEMVGEDLFKITQEPN